MYQVAKVTNLLYSIHRKFEFLHDFQIYSPLSTVSVETTREVTHPSTDYKSSMEQQ